jgi:hypothetical protein
MVGDRNLVTKFLGMDQLIANLKQFVPSSKTRLRCRIADIGRSKKDLKRSTRHHSLFG